MSNWKLNFEDVLVIRYLWDNKKCTQTKLAEDFDVCLTTIHHIVHRESWLGVEQCNY